MTGVVMLNENSRLAARDRVELALESFAGRYAGYGA